MFVLPAGWSGGCKFLTEMNPGVCPLCTRDPSIDRQDHTDTEGKSGQDSTRCRKEEHTDTDVNSGPDTRVRKDTTNSSDIVVDRRHNEYMTSVNSDNFEIEEHTINDDC